MKLAAKIALCLVALLGLVFAVGGFVLISSNFARGLESVQAQSLTGHLNTKESLRAQMANALYSGSAVQDRDVSLWGGQLAPGLAANSGSCAVLDAAANPVYNNLPNDFGKRVQTAILAQPRYSQLFYRFAGKTYLVFPDKILLTGAQYQLITAFDISALFLERQAQTHTFYTVYAVVLVCAALLAAGLSLLITRPLRRLEKAAQSIAEGAYGQRTGLAGQDEIAQLAARFDEMAAAVQRQVDALRLAARQREEFMGAFTHELKTPMTAMMGYAALLQKNALERPEREKALGYMYSETRRLEDLSQKLLQLMGLSEEEIQLEPTPLAGVFERLRKAFPEVGGAGATGAGDAGPGRHGASGHEPGGQLLLPDGGDICMRADADLLADLLINLVRNGFAAQPPGGWVQISVEEDTEVAENGEVLGLLTLCVQDRGKGIAPEALARLTEPFYQVEKDRHTGGSGLGLALCARIAQLHGTELRFESAPGKGTVVCITLQTLTL